MDRNNRFIVDTNALLSSFFISGSVTFKAVDKAVNTGILLFSNDTFLEFELVLFRKKFDKYFSQEERLQIVEKMYNDATLVPVTSNIQLCRDPKDDKFLNLAIDSNASCIISGDKDLIVLNPFREIPILPPADFLDF